MSEARRKILVTSALPYANGPIHLGHMVEYIQTDIWVRFQKMRGHDCIYVCADDAHGTPIMLRSQSEGITPEQLVERIGREHRTDFAEFRICFDNYHTTNSSENRERAQLIYLRLRDGGHIVSRSITQAYDPVKEMFDNKVYFAQDTAYGSIYEWDNLDQPLQEMEWKSKVLISQDYNNLGAARVVDGYTSSSVQWEAYDENWETAELTWDANTGVNFKLWADKTLIYDQTITDDEIFRLPSGYRSDTFEFGVEGDIRVRAIHIGQTPLDLKED